MKTLKIMMIIVACALLFIACNSGKNPDLAGTYVTSFKNEYTIADDTLVVEVFNQESNTYKVKRYSGYERIREGKILPKAYERENWTATFDPDKQVLQETQLGRQLYINTQAGTISFGATYHKVK